MTLEIRKLQSGKASEENPRESRSQNGAEKPAREELGSKNGMWKGPEVRPGWGIWGQKAGLCSGREKYEGEEDAGRQGTHHTRPCRPGRALHFLLAMGSS